jgi:Carboxypeptidase regulatory-like domain
MFEARKLYGFLFILLLLTTAAFGQEFTGNINGRVSDASGAVIPGVTITLNSSAIQGTRQAISGETGVYQFRLLPVGTYAVKFELPGFKTVIREGVIVEVGKITTINMALEVATQAETVTVTGESPVVDTQTATVGVNFNQGLLRDIPNSRDIWIVLAQSPGINTTRYDVGGSTMGSQTGFRAYGTSSQNWFNLDGIVTNDSAGSAGWYFDYGSFQEIQVSSAANAAEVPVPGAFMNTVIKSGGNDFHGRAYIDWEASGFQGQNVSSDMSRTCPANATAAAGFSGYCGLFTGDQFSRYNDFNTDAGGPIKKDKLWWYFSWRDQYSDLKTQLGVADTAETMFGMPGSGSNAASDATFVTQGGHYTTRLRIPTLKLTWQVTNNNSFQFMWQHSRKKAPYRQGSGGNAYKYIIESTGNQKDPSDGRKWEWTSVLSPKLTLDLKITDSEYVFPIYSHVEKSPISDSVTGFVRGGYPNPNVGWRKHWDWGGNLAYFKEGLGGTHNFKVGYDVYWELGRNFNLTYPGGGYSLSLNNGVPNTFTIKDGPFTTANGVYQNAFFVQDKWQIGRKLTINIGARWDRYSSYYPEQGNSHSNGIFDIAAIQAAYPTSNIRLSLDGGTSVPRTIVSVFDNWVPRFAISYDLFGNGKTALKASGGKFSWNPSTDIVRNANPNVTPTYTFKWDGTLPITQSYIISAKPAFQSQSVNASQVIDPNLTNSWTDEYTAGIDQEVIQNLGVRVNYVRKLEQNPYANVNLSRTIDYFTPVTKVDRGPDGITGTADDQNITVYNLDTQYLGLSNTKTTNFAGYGSNYSTFEIIATKRMSDRWMAMFSWDKSKRNLRQDVTFDPNTLAWGGNRDAHIWDWQLKTVFMYQFPYDINFTTTYDSQKGETFGRSVTITGLNQGNLTATVEPQGKNFYPTSKLWNLRAEKKFKISERQSIDGMFDLFNIPNLNTIIGWTTNSNNPYLFTHQVSTIINPRIFRLGMRYNF